MVIVEALFESIWRCFGEQIPNTDVTCGLTEAETLARARKQAQQNSNKRVPSMSSSSTNLDKSIIRSNKRKADIFRSKAVPEEERPSKPMPYHGILCFANPIQSDGEEYDFQQQHEDIHDGDDTVTSTIYFDAKYEHVVQSRPPMPLYMEYSVPVSESHDDEISKIVQQGTHKSIHMFMDGDNIQSRWYQDHVCKTPSRDNEEGDAECFSSSQDDQEEQPFSLPASRLEVISDWVGLSEKKQRISSMDRGPPPGLKLLSNSSVSTAALTDVGPSCSMVSVTRQNSTPV